jgi:flotillin
MIGVAFVLLLTAVVVGVFLSLVVRSLLYVSEPNEALVFSGRRRELGDREIGYRLVRGGRSLRVPLLEKVERIDLTTFTIDVTVQNAYSRGGIPLNVVGVANVKVAGEEPLVNNAVERFLGKPKADIMKIAKETLEGNLRGVLAQLTPEQVNEDKTRFAQTLIEEAEHDMHRMGLALDTLKIQNVSDDVGYLLSIGRIRGSVVRQGASIAEVGLQADAAVQKATNTMNANLAQVDSELEIARQQYKKRVLDAQTKREALIQEAVGQVRSQIAQVTAEIERQRARVLQVRRKLDAEVVQPAEAERAAAEERARGEASRIVEQGKAEASALGALVEQYKRAGGAAREVLVLQKLFPLVGAIAGVGQKLTVRKLAVLPSAEPPDGRRAGEGEELARRAIRTAEELRAATGIDLAGLARRLGGPPSKPE